MTERDLDLLWGADEIARAIGKTRRQTFWLLENGQLPAKKIGRQWCISRKVLTEYFEGAAA